MKPSPAFPSLESLIAFYQELSLPRQPHWVIYVKIIIRRGMSFIDKLIHKDPDHIKDRRFWYRGRPAELLKRVDNEGNKYPVRFEESIESPLYHPASMVAVGQVFDSPEWLLLFKIDGDIARRKYGRPEFNLVAYLEGWAPIHDKEIAARRNALRRDSIGHVPQDFIIKSNTQDLIERYGKDDSETLAWIISHAKELESADFYSESHRDPLLDIAGEMNHAIAGDGARDAE